MMRSRLARIGVAATGLLALLGVTTPPAHATTVGTFVFQGTAQLDEGLGYPCAGTTPDKCPQGVGNPGTPLTLTTKSLPLPTPAGTVELGNTTYVHGGNNRAITNFSSNVCANDGVTVAKLNKATTHAGTCSISGAGSVTGWCGLSTGLVSGTITDALGQTYAFRVHFYGVASELVVSGHATKQTNTPQTLLVRGVVNAVPIPAPLPIPEIHAPNNSCAAKTARTFDVQGSVSAAG